MGDGSATRWSGCWKRTTIGGSLGRTVLSPRPVANDRFKPSLVGRINARCRLQRPSHPPQQPLQSQSLQRLTIGPRTTCFRFSAGSAIRFSAPLHKGSRKVSHLPPGGVCPDRVVAGSDIFSRDWVKSCRRAVLLWPYLRSHAPHARLVKTSLSHVDEDKLRDLIKTSAQQAEALRLA